MSVRKWGFQVFRIDFKKLSSYRNLWSIWLIHDATRNPWPIHDHADDANQNSKNAPERWVRRTEVYTCSKSMTNPRLCWWCWPKTEKSHPKGGCVEPSWHVRLRENLNKTRNQSNSRPQNGQIMRKRNEPKMAHFPNTSISTGILENWKVSWSTLSNFSIFWEIP